MLTNKTNNYPVFDFMAKNIIFYLFVMQKAKKERKKTFRLIITVIIQKYQNGRPINDENVFSLDKC